MDDHRLDCFSCPCWDSDAECCTMPSVDKFYACSLCNSDYDQSDCVDEGYPGVSSLLLPDDEVWSDNPDVYSL